MDKDGIFAFGRDLGRRRHAQTSIPMLYFRDGVLSIPGYAFEEVRCTSLIKTKQYSNASIGCAVDGYR
jgi:hypothetical protein